MEILRKPRTMFDVFSDVKRMGKVYYNGGDGSYDEVLWDFMEHIGIGNDRRFEAHTDQYDTEYYRIIIDQFEDNIMIKLRVENDLISAREYFDKPAYKLYKRKMTIKKILK